MSEQAENQAGGAPDSGGKAGEGADPAARLAALEERAMVINRRIDGMAIFQQALDKYMDEIKGRMEKLEAKSSEPITGPLSPDAAAYFREVTERQARGLGRLPGALAPVRDPDGPADRTPGEVGRSAQVGPEKWVELLGPEACEEPIVTSWLHVWRCAPPSVGERQVLANMVRELVLELHRARMELLQQALKPKAFTAEFRESLQREQPGGFERLDRSVRPATELVSAGGMTAEDFLITTLKESSSTPETGYRRGDFALEKGSKPPKGDE